MSRRSTREIVIIVLAVGFVVALAAATVGIIVIRADDPSADVGTAAAAVGSILTATFGVIIGFVVGRKNGTS